MVIDVVLLLRKTINSLMFQFIITVLVYFIFCYIFSLYVQSYFNLINHLFVVYSLKVIVFFNLDGFMIIFIFNFNVDFHCFFVFILSLNSVFIVICVYILNCNPCTTFKTRISSFHKWLFLFFC